MFLVLNTSKKTINLPSIFVNIAPKQAVDLDSVTERSLAEKDSHLMALIKDRTIRVLQKTTERTSSSKSKAIQGVDIQDIKREIVTEVSKTVAKQISKISQPKSDSSDMRDLLDTIIGEIRNNNQNISTKIREDKPEEDIDDDVATRIGEKNINKMIGNVKSKIQEEKSDNNSGVNSIADDLEEFFK